MVLRGQWQAAWETGPVGSGTWRGKRAHFGGPCFHSCDTGGVEVVPTEKWTRGVHLTDFGLCGSRGREWTVMWTLP